MNAVPVEKVVPYACQDADLTLELSDLLWPKVQEGKLEKLYREIEQPLIEVLADMEIWGVKVDRAALEALSAEFEAELGRLEKKIFELSGTEFNINSPQQLGDILFHKIQLQPSRKTRITKRFSTSIEVLQELAALHPSAQYALEYRQLAKLKGTYADALPLIINPETGRIHTSYNQTVAATGRLSSSEPNLQNIPTRGEIGQRFRRAFIPEKGLELLVADYSQIELRVLAHLSADAALAGIFVADRDVHEETARAVFGEALPELKGELRRKAKVINFSIIYGTSAFSLAKELGTSAPGGPGVHGPLLRPAPRRFRVPGERRPRGRGERLYRNHLRPDPAGAGAQAKRPRGPAGRTPDRAQRARPGLGGRPDEKSDDRHLARPQIAPAEDQDHPPGP